MTWGMNPEGLYSAGVSMSNLETDASTATTGFRDSVLEAGAAAHHPTVRGALDGYWKTWSGTANRLPGNVKAGGSQLSRTAGLGQEIDLKAAEAMSAPLGSVQTAGSALTRSIEGEG